MDNSFGVFFRCEVRLIVNFIVQLCLRGEDPQSPQARRRCGTIAGTMGILLNLLLSGSKLLAGLLTASVAMTADGLNNLSDAATSVVTLIGFRLAGQEADADHPFGHGRIEYVAGLIVSLAILLMGVTAADSLSDTLSTAVVLLSTLLGHFFQLHVDGLAGLLVCAFILKTGWEAARDTLDPLLGRPMDPELAADIDKLVLGHDHILGIHDLPTATCWRSTTSSTTSSGS